MSVESRMKRAEILKSLRVSRNKSQADAAKELGITQQGYFKYEAGASDPNPDQLCILADFFEVSVDCLLGREAPIDALDLLVAQTDRSASAFSAVYESLTEEAKAIAITQMRMMTSGAANSGSHSISTWVKLHKNKASAGRGYSLADKDAWDSIRVVNSPEARVADFAVMVDGDSMEPDYHDGSIVYIKLDPDIPEGTVGLFVVEGDGFIKVRGKRGLMSLNKKYKEIRKEARCIGRVIGIAERI